MNNHEVEGPRWSTQLQTGSIWCRGRHRRRSNKPLKGERIRVVIGRNDGHFGVFLHNQWDFPDHGASVQHLLGLSVDQLIAAVLHDELDWDVTHVLLTGDVVDH